MFSSMLTAENVADIERIQKIALKVILDDQYQSYDQACQLLGTIPLENRRKQLSLKFALACLKSPQHKHHFMQRLSPYYKLRKIKSFEEPFCHSQRYYLSPIPYLVNISKFGKIRTFGKSRTKISIIYKIQKNL